MRKLNFSVFSQRQARAGLIRGLVGFLLGSLIVGLGASMGKWGQEPTGFPGGSWWQGKAQEKLEQKVSDELPRFGSLPDFELVDQDGQPFKSKHSLQGRVWIGAFFFTRCKGPCPVLTKKLGGISQTLAISNPGVYQVSFTVDPERDDPAALRTYGERFKADFTRWHFLTGPRDVLESLARDGMRLPLSDHPELHSTRFVLVDAQGVVRGYYEGGQAEAIAELVQNAQRLDNDLRRAGT